MQSIKSGSDAGVYDAGSGECRLPASTIRVVGGGGSRGGNDGLPRGCRQVNGSIRCSPNGR